MLILKLNAPISKVNYNKLGRLISAPVPFTPDKLKATGLDLEITGYLCEDCFFATELVSETRSFSRAEQYSLLKQLGFKVLPIQVNENDSTTENTLITTAQRYSKYEAAWWSEDKQKEVELPVLNTIISIDWKLDDVRRLVKQVTTESGKYDVVDHSCPEYYQPGSVVKIKDGKVFPYKGSVVTVNTPSFCPLCNNPLARMQVSYDTPLIFKCKSPFCMKNLRSTEDKLPEVVTEDSEDTFRGQKPEEADTVKISEPTVPQDLSTPENADTDSDMILVSCDISSLPHNVNATLIKPDQLGDSKNVAGILVKSTRSISKRSRKLKEDTGLSFIYLDDLKGEE